jgi:hypothetical protein
MFSLLTPTTLVLAITIQDVPSTQAAAPTPDAVRSFLETLYECQSRADCPVCSFAWSGDETRMVYVRSDYESSRHGYVTAFGEVDLVAGGSRELELYVERDVPAVVLWSPDGKFAVVHSFDSLSIVSMPDWRADAVKGRFPATPCVTPDSKRLLFLGISAQLQASECGVYEIRLGAPSEGARLLLPVKHARVEEHDAAHLEVSPGGAYIAWDVRTTHSKEPLFELSVGRLVGGEIRDAKVLKTSTAWRMSWNWLPNREIIAVATVHGLEYLDATSRRPVDDQYCAPKTEGKEALLKWIDYSFSPEGKYMGGTVRINTRRPRFSTTISDLRDCDRHSVVDSGSDDGFISWSPRGSLCVSVVGRHEHSVKVLTSREVDDLFERASHAAQEPRD